MTEQGKKTSPKCSSHLEKRMKTDSHIDIKRDKVLFRRGVIKELSFYKPTEVPQSALRYPLYPSLLVETNVCYAADKGKKHCFISIPTGSSI